MMSDIEKYLNQAIELELNISDLYLLFYSLFPQDSNFWWALSIEEKNHAALLKNLKQLYDVSHKVPDEVNPQNINEIESINKAIKSGLLSFKEHPERKKAFEYALTLEQSAGEAHYQKFAENENLPPIFEVFRQLNMDDKNHATRIRNYMLQNVKGDLS